MQRKVNDVGGLVGSPIDQVEHDPTFYEKRIDALLMLLTGPKVKAFSVDSLRRAVEQNSPEDYSKRGYYEKWLLAIRQLLVEQQILSDDEIDRRIEEIKRKKG
jgi:nitrile hydratase